MKNGPGWFVHRRVKLAQRALWVLFLVSVVSCASGGCQDQAIEGIDYGTEAAVNNFSNNDPFNDGASPSNNDDLFNNAVDNHDDPGPDAGGPCDEGCPDGEGCPEEECDGPMACEQDSDCGDGAVCVAQVCVAAGDPAVDYDWSAPSSVLSAVALVIDPAVVVDVDSDGTGDNALASLLVELEAVIGPVDPNTALSASLEGVGPLMGVVWSDIEGLDSGAEDVSLDVMSLQREGEAWLAESGSFLPGTAEPRVTLNGGVSEGSYLSAEPWEAALPVTLSLGPIEVPLSLKLGSLTGELAVSGEGVALSDGVLAGALPVRDVVAGVNAFVGSDACACLGLDGPLIDLDAPQDAACNASATPEACGESVAEAQCASLAGACSLWVSVMSGGADLDLDADGAPDAYSLMMTLEMSPAVVEGVAAGR